MKIISHRGNNVSVYSKNTKEALISALETSFIDGIEFDIRITKDKKIVIIHDPVINLVSNGSGLVSKMTLKKLRKYNFGSKEYPSKICTLEELLNNINSNKIILIELKFEGSQYKSFVDIVYNIIKKYNLNIYICSFNNELLKYFYTKYKKCGLLIGNCINDKRLYNHFYFNIVSYNYRNIISQKETFLWTINEYKKDLGKFYIITDTPYIFKSFKY